MANITVGINASLKSPTAEGQLHECCAFLEIGEYTPARNPNGIDNLIGQHQQNQRLFTATFSIPVEPQIDGEGKPYFAVSEYLTELPFSPGTGGTFKSGNAAAYFVELVTFIQNLERDVAKNPGKKDNVTGRFDIDRGVFTGSLSLPISLSISPEGKIVYSADTYLL